MNLRLIFTLFLCISVNASFCQFHIVIQRNVDVYKPYTKEAQEYMQINPRVYSNTQHLQTSYTFSNQTINFSAGIGYKLIHHEVKDKIQYLQFNNSSNGSVYYQYIPTDLISTSHSVSVLCDVQHTINNHKKYSGNIGSRTEFFFFELFQAEFKSSAGSQTQIDPLYSR